MRVETVWRERLMQYRAELGGGQLEMEVTI